MSNGRRDQLAAKLERIAKCIFIAAEESVASDISQTALEAADVIRTDMAEACEALRAVVNERGCGDPDCCDAARAQDAAIGRARVLLAKIDGEAR